MPVYNTAWLSLALVLTALLGVLTFIGWRSRGTSALLLGSGLTLLPMAAYLTGTLRLFATIFDLVAGYFTGFVFSPRVWVGVALAGCAVALIIASRVVKRWAAPPSVKSGAEPRSMPAARKPVGAPAIDDDLADIEAILRKRGIQ